MLWTSDDNQSGSAVQSHRAASSEDPGAWALVLCGYHLEILDNVIFKFVFSK